MATDLEKLVVELSAKIGGYEREMRRAQGITNQTAQGIENRFRQMNRNLDGIGKNIGRGLVAPLTGLAAALSVREVISYADAWTVAGNKIAAAGSIAGRQGRTLEELNEIATRTRSGITETVDLYAKLLRSTASVAQSEEEVARATEIVNKAFKAGGAAASEQAAGILQLSQALGSGVLQGDELRSLRENAPLIAQAIADEFNTTIGGLKALGEAGELVIGRVFKAILNAQPQIEAAFASTNQTIGDGFARINNAFIEYIGHTDDGLSATERLVGGLNALADNFDDTADVALQFAGVIAAALVGRAIGGMILKLGIAGTALVRFTALARTAGLAAALGSLGVAAGPIGAALGVAAAAAIYLGTSSSGAAERTERLKTELRSMGLLADDAAESIDTLADSMDGVGSEEQRRRLRDYADELENVKESSFLGDPFTENIDLQKLGDVADRLAAIRDTYGMGIITGDAERAAAGDIEKAIRAYAEGNIEAEELLAALDKVAALNLSQPMDDLITATRKLIPYVDALNTGIRIMAASGEEASEALLDAARRVAAMRGPSFRSAESESMEALGQEQIKTQAFLAEQEAEARRSDFDRALDVRTDQILKGAEELGLILSRASARAAAKIQLGIESAAQDVQGAIGSFVDEVVHHESSGDTFATTDRSSATGLGQFIKETWIALFKQEFPDRAKNMSEEAILALRTNGDISRKLIEAYARENAAVLQAAGVSVDKAALHLAHFLGPGDAVKVLQAASGTPLQGLISSKSIAANPEVLGGGATVDDAIAYAQARTQIETAIRGEKSARDALIAGIEAEIEALGLEARAFGQSTFEAEKARVAFDLRQQAIAAGLELTPKLIAEIDRLAAAYANASVAVETAAKGQDKFGESQQAAMERMDAFRSAAKDVLGGFISDLAHGKSAADALANALENILNKLLDIMLNNLFQGGGLGGLLGGGGGVRFGITPGIHHQGGIAGQATMHRHVPAAAFLGAPRYHSGGIAGLHPGEVPAILKAGELIIPNGPRRVAGGGPVQVVQRLEVEEIPGRKMKAEQIPDGRGTTRLTFDPIAEGISGSRRARGAMGLPPQLKRRA